MEASARKKLVTNAMVHAKKAHSSEWTPTNVKRFKKKATQSANAIIKRAKIAAKILHKKKPKISAKRAFKEVIMEVEAGRLK